MWRSGGRDKRPTFARTGSAPLDQPAGNNPRHEGTEPAGSDVASQPGSGSQAGAVSDQRLTSQTVLAIAVPIILSNVTTPLIGVADTTVLGQLGAAHLIGAVALGGTIFSFLFWAFGFLRMGTTGLTAQAAGRGDRTEIAASLGRALLIALVAGAGLLALQLPLIAGALAMLGGSQQVEDAARLYCEIRIWSAPAALINFALVGWFVGLGKAGRAFSLQLLLNLVNIALDIAFVLYLDWGVAGVAIGTVAAEVLAAVVGLWLAWRELGGRKSALQVSHVLDRVELARAIGVNRDIMIRTMSLLFAFSFFTAQGAQAGDLTLAANAVLFQFFSVAAYFLDGFAYAATALVGAAIGARNRRRFIDAAWLSSVWAVAISAGVALLFWLTGGLLIDFMTTNSEVRAAAREYLPWAAASPALGVFCFQLDGIFLGATRARDMRNMMLISLLVYLLAWWVLTPIFGNHGLWAALSIFFIMRAATLSWRLPGLLREVFQQSR